MLKAVIGKSIVLALYIVLVTGWIVYLYTGLIDILVITNGRGGSPGLKLNDSSFLLFYFLTSGGLVATL